MSPASATAAAVAPAGIAEPVTPCCIGRLELSHCTALESGVHIKAVADLLGRNSIAITGDVYGHTSDDTARAAADGLAGRLGL
jgi:integrase